MSDRPMSFAESKPGARLNAPRAAGADPWKVLISDDERDVHEVTVYALKGITFDERPIEFLHAYDTETTRRLLSEQTDIALVLQDVVMETDSSGLETVKFVREELQNRLVRIVLRTGQPGQAPEREVIVDYDINDYKEKTELTAQKLFTTVIASLRGYSDLLTIDKNRQGLTKIINASANFFAYRSIHEFAQGMLMQVTSLLKISDGSLSQRVSGFTANAAVSDERFSIVSGTGTYEGTVGSQLDQVLDPEGLELISESLRERKSFFKGSRFVGHFETSLGLTTLLYVVGRAPLSEMDKQLLMTFFANISIAFENIYLNNELQAGQLSIIQTLGQVVESRSPDTAKHTQRIGMFAARLAELMNVSAREVEMLRIAAPMHDIGKVGISDTLLHKPGTLTADEYETIKQHTTIGRDIFSGTNRPLQNLIAVIAHQHHERWDGAGYPHGLKGSEIHLMARITALVDTFDALGHQRSYKEAWDPEEIRRHIAGERGAAFDPDITDVFLRNYEEFVAQLDCCGVDEPPPSLDP